MRVPGRRLVGVVAVAIAMVAACGTADDGGAPSESLPVDATEAPVVTSGPTTPESTTVAPAVTTPPPNTVPTTAATPTLPPVSTVPFDDAPVTAETIDVVFDTLENTCASCHAPGGPGSTHWELTRFGDAAEFADTLAEDTTARVMPPWPASQLGLDFVGSLALSDGQISAIRSWAAAGAPLGEREMSTPVVAQGSAGPVIDRDAVVTAAEPYRGAGSVVDDYRCQVYDPALSDAQWVRGWAFEPDQTEVIHHAVVFAADAGLRAEAEARDRAEDGPGWSCYGLSGLGGRGGEPKQIMGWAPGQAANVLPEETALRLEAGDFLIVQVHYHYDDLIDVPADASAMVLDYLDDADIAAAGGSVDPISVEVYLAPAEIPCSVGESGPLCDRDAVLEQIAGRFGTESAFLPDGLLFLCGARVSDFSAMTGGIASSSCDHRVRTSGEVVGLFGHMHEIGAAFRMTLNPGRPDERVLLDIPRWNFEWQLQYLPVEALLLERGDVLRIECTWDRSKRSPELEPAYVTWAEGTNDEMCYSTVTTRPVG